MNSTKKLTEAALLSSLFVVITIFAVGIGFGYALYLDFIVPVFFCIILLKCDFRYTVLSGITSLVIIGLVLGNIGTAIWATQSVVLGILCGVLMSKNGTVLDDILIGSILGIILMVFIDMYASKLIGYSFMKEFQDYANLFKYKKFSMTIYYIFIAVFPMGTVFSIYVLSLLFAKKLNILKNNAKRKMNVITNFKACIRFICLSKNTFYDSLIYIIVTEIINLLNISIESVYLKTIIICMEYVCFYFIIKDGYTFLQNYVISKYQNIAYFRIVSIISLIMLILMFKLTTLILISINIILDKKIGIRRKQIMIIDNYINNLIVK